MGKVIAEFTMSLDGFIAGPGDDVGRLFKWYRSGDTDFSPPDSEMVFKVSRPSAEYLQESWSKIGVIVTGRRDFDVSKAWGGQSPLGVPIIIVTHSPPQEWLREGSPFLFDTRGVVSAIERARQIAGERVIGVSGTQITRQCLKAGLIDEIHIELAPILLGDGIRLFDHLETGPIDLEILRVIDTPSVTHLSYRVVK